MKNNPFFLFSMLVLAYPLLAADVLNHPDQQRVIAEVQGIIVQIDVNSGRFTVKDEGGQIVSATMVNDTRVLDTENHEMKWTTLRSGDRILLYYNTKEHTAVQIDLHPKLAENIIAPEHPH